MDLRIKDKVYLVTGGGSGIGGGISVALAREGAIPVILGRSPLQKSFRAEVRALQPLMHFIQIELTDEQACADAVQEAVSMYGRIDGLINCAGGNDNVSLETGVEAFRVSLERNLVHYYTMAHYCIGELKKSKGSILNVSSKTALTGQGGTSGYTAAKGGILSLTREWAASYLKDGIRVNAVAPGTVDTPGLHDGARDTGDERRGLESFLTLQPLKRFGQPEEIANVVRFLVDEQASFVHGAVVMADGGYTIV